MGKQAVINFRLRGRRIGEFYLKSHGEPHFVYEFLNALENIYECSADEIPVRFAQLVGNFVGRREEIYPWPSPDDFREDNGVYGVQLDVKPWAVRRSIAPQSTSPWPEMNQDLSTEDVKAEHKAAQKHPLIASGDLRREIRDKNDRHFMRLQSVSSHAHTPK